MKHSIWHQTRMDLIGFLKKQWRCNYRTANVAIHKTGDYVRITKPAVSWELGALALLGAVYEIE